MNKRMRMSIREKRKERAKKRISRRTIRIEKVKILKKKKKTKKNLKTKRVTTMKKMMRRNLKAKRKGRATTRIIKTRIRPVKSQKVRTIRKVTRIEAVVLEEERAEELNKMVAHLKRVNCY